MVPPNAYEMMRLRAELARRRAERLAPLRNEARAERRRRH
jgi:hypothetical protein